MKPRRTNLMKKKDDNLFSLSVELNRKIERCKLLLENDSPLANKLMAIVIAMNGELGKNNDPVEEALIANAIFKAWAPFLEEEASLERY